jgi:plasmid stability protein
MLLTLNLPPATERRLAEKAAAAGVPVEAVAVELLIDALCPAEEQTFAEIAAPFAAEFAASGMTEEELDELVEQAREEIWQEKNGYPSKRPATPPPPAGAA